MLPLSRLCDTDPFRRFVLHLLGDAERFATIHNDALAEYRRVNRVRSQTHPTPTLERTGSWIETPFWIWSADRPDRRKAFVQQREGEWRFGAPGEMELSIDNPQRSPQTALRQLQDATIRQGIRIRSRAITTTMFARLFLSDLFLHGIGGAKYDQLTDALIERYWRLPPPRMVVVTATVQLPLATREVSPAELRELDYASRQMRFKPEQFLVDPDDQTRQLIDEKARWVAESPSRGEGQPRRLRINEINATLSSRLESQRQEVIKQRRALESEERLARMTRSREFSYCLHSSRTLPSLLLDLCPKHP